MSRRRISERHIAAAFAIFFAGLIAAAAGILALAKCTQ